ncbi:hypothetical protein A2160_05560 [Candidatus Beckwithbacteria bacterium RBG_13_42_9]|uniref:Uncharacterized protein n=1 Tax=Candidatus Beckwithbacteria bacterium RBG_13_42_9 TaxID=1797457 RepID=A0A1F5E5X0_9BACT|nr:MAG: hypothetical protein A2160_05560 [Candidatus Beckwithbacteria bacterium RBG_13_42_9]
MGKIVDSLADKLPPELEELKPVVVNAMIALEREHGFTVNVLNAIWRATNCNGFERAANLAILAVGDNPELSLKVEAILGYPD